MATNGGENGPIYEQNALGKELICALVGANATQTYTHSLSPVSFANSLPLFSFSRSIFEKLCLWS